MAKFTANSAFDYNKINISGLRDADSGFEDNANVTFNGVKYQDVVWFGDDVEEVNFGGTGITLNGDQVTGGTVTGVLVQKASGANWVTDWMLQGISVSAVSIYSAALSTGKTDDMTVLSNALAGADTFNLSKFADKMRGFGGNDLMKGNAGNDQLAGDGGNDTLVGGAGADRLTGGAGKDVFDYNKVGESGLNKRDTITDFTRGQDRIDLSGIDANTALGGNQAFTGFIKATAKFSKAGQLKFVDGVLYGNTDADAQAEFAINLTGVSALSAADIIL